MPVSKAKAAQVADRRRQAVQLRLAGIDLATIADRLGYSSAAAVSVDVSRALEQTAKALQLDADKLRQVEVERLDRAQAAIWTRVTQGDDRAILSLLRIMQRRARLLGLDAPVRVRQEFTSEFDREIQELVARLDAGNSPARRPVTAGAEPSGDEDLPV